MKNCRNCGHSEFAHFTRDQRPCLHSGCNCLSFDAGEPIAAKDPPMFAVRIDKVESTGKYIFSVQPTKYTEHELIALDSAPGVIAFVHAPDPGAAAARAWEKGERELASLGGLPPSTPEKLLELLGDKKPEGGST